MERVPGNVRRSEGFAVPPELARFFNDFATLRRALIDARLLARERCAYRRV